MRLVAGDNNLDCERLGKPELPNPIIADSTKGRDILQIQEDQKVEWKGYTCQKVVDLVAFKAIISAVNAQYVE